MKSSDAIYRNVTEALAAAGRRAGAREDQFLRGSVSLPITRIEDRIPHRATTTHPAPITVIVDTRERQPPAFDRWVTLERATLHEGDFSTPFLRGVAAIERKNPDDFHASFFSDNRDRLEREILRLQAYEWRCIVVEGHLERFFGNDPGHKRSVIGTIASLLARDIPVQFVGGAAECGQFIAKVLRSWERKYERLVPRGACYPPAPRGPDLLRETFERLTNEKRRCPMSRQTNELTAETAEGDVVGLDVAVRDPATIVPVWELALAQREAQQETKRRQARRMRAVRAGAREARGR